MPPTIFSTNNLTLKAQIRQAILDIFRHFKEKIGKFAFQMFLKNRTKFKQNNDAKN